MELNDLENRNIRNSMNFSSTKRKVFNLKAGMRKFCYKLETCILGKKKKERKGKIYTYISFMGRITMSSEL